MRKIAYIIPGFREGSNERAYEKVSRFFEMKEL